MAATIHGADRFGIRSPADWRKLGSTPIDVEVSVWKDPGPGIYRIPIARRRGFFLERTRRIRESLLRAFRITQFSKRNDQVLSLRLPADQILPFSRRQEVNFISVLKVPGRRRRELGSRRSLGWYSVRARFAIRVEGRSRNTWEDRILMVKAVGFEEAERLARKEFKRYRSTNLGTTLRRVTWEFDSVVEIFYTFVEDLVPRGTEVWSSIQRRRP